MTGKRSEKFTTDKWVPIATILISIIGILISGISLYNSYAIKKQYSKSVDEVIESSAKISLYDLKLLEFKVLQVGESNPKVDTDDLNFQITGLQNQLKVIESVNITDLPKNDVMDYLVYRSDLSDAVYQLNTSLKDAKEDWDGSQNKKHRIFVLSPHDYANMLDQIRVNKAIINDDRKAILNGKRLYNLTYNRASKKLSKLLREYSKG